VRYSSTKTPFINLWSERFIQTLGTREKALSSSSARGQQANRPRVNSPRRRVVIKRAEQGALRGRAHPRGAKGKGLVAMAGRHTFVVREPVRLLAHLVHVSREPAPHPRGMAQRAATAAAGERRRLVAANCTCKENSTVTAIMVYQNKESTGVIISN
jgi:hypothetical protein